MSICCLSYEEDNSNRSSVNAATFKQQVDCMDGILKIVPVTYYDVSDKLKW